MPSTTRTNHLGARLVATALAQTDRAAFDAEYDAWLAQDRLDGTPDYTDHYKDDDALLRAVLGEEHLQEVTSQMDEALARDDMNVYSALEASLDAISTAYSETFGPLPK